MQDPSPARFCKERERIEGGFATPLGYDRDRGELSGCIYRADGSKVALSERFGGFKGDYFQSVNPNHTPVPRDARRLEGRGLYLGHLMSAHYGHFLVETLSTFWIFEEFFPSRFDYFMFHDFPWGGPLKPYARLCLERFGIDPDRVVRVRDRPVRVEELLVPERLLRLNHSADPALRAVYRRIAEGAAQEGTRGRRLYLSRRRLEARASRRLVVNEARVEAAFRAAGFDVVYPETLAFERQLALYASAEALAGMSGTALHNCLFMPPGGLVVELEDARYGGPAPTQALCYEIAGVRGRFIPFRGTRLPPTGGVRLFDIRHVAEALHDILRNEGFAGSASPPRPAFWTLQEAVEVAWRAARPSLRNAARRLTSRKG